jgi:hypothetical protein
VELLAIPGALWISRLDVDAEVTMRSVAPFFSVTRTADEVSIVGPHPVDGAKVEGPWRAFRVGGVLDFSLTGVMHELTGPLAEAGISVFVQSTFDTDYLLVRADSVSSAVTAWTDAGYRVVEESA